MKSQFQSRAGAMNRAPTISWLLTSAALIGCRPAATPVAAPADQPAGSAAPQVAGAAGPSTPTQAIDFDGERYSLKRSHVQGTETIHEYLRDGETPSSWRQRLVVTDSRGAFDLRGFVKAYADSLTSGLAVNKDVYEYGTDSMIVYSYLVEADHTQIALLRAVSIPNVGIRSYLFVVKVPSEEKAKVPEYTAKRDRWLNQIAALHAAP